MRVTLFVPCYNVAGSVVGVLNAIPSATLDQFSEILLIDNGSTDGTREVLSAFISQAPKKFRLFFNQENYSLGGSAIIAIRESLAGQSDFLICMHSDGQADPADLAHFFPLLPEEDFVFGSRMLPESRTESYSRARHWGNLFFSRLQQLLIGQKVFDIGAFVAMNLHKISQYPYYRIGANMAYFPALVLYLASKQNLKCREFPIFWGRVERSNVNIFSYGASHLVRLMRMGLGIYALSDRELSYFRSIEQVK